MNSKTDRHALGIELMQETQDQEAAERIRRSSAEICPEAQLAVHFRGALNVGVSPREITEAIFHVALYAGHPRAVNGFRVARETFEELGIAVEARS